MHRRILRSTSGRRMASTTTRAASARQRSRDAGSAPALTERSLSFLVRHAHRAFVTKLADRLIPHDVSVAEWAVLRMLWQQEGLTQVSLADRMRMQKSSLTSVLNNLERKGLMRRTRRGDDRRKHHLFLTQHGRGLKAELLPIGAAINQRALIGIDREDAALAANLLEKVIANLDK
jgi:MarR family transcriptional regulator, organic hydroperoxide resistance regulator